MMVVVIFGAVEISILAHSADRSASALLIASPVIIWGAGVAALFASVRFQAVIREKLQRQGRLVQRLGLMTFPLYLNHYSLGRVLVFSLVSSGLGEFSSFAIAFTLICGSSWLIMLYPEQMLQSALRRLFGLNSRYLRESPKLSEISSFEENVGRASLP
jgi:peptidoglycan/LPS O-acetylase OafA/YrhL